MCTISAATISGGCYLWSYVGELGYVGILSRLTVVYALCRVPLRLFPALSPKYLSSFSLYSNIILFCRLLCEITFYTWVWKKLNVILLNH